MSCDYTPDAIQSRALETWNGMDPLVHATLGLVGEAGEFADTVKKLLFKPNWESRKANERLLDELGDVLFYLAILSHQFGVTLDGLSRMNYDKLQEREANEEGYDCTS